MKNDNRREFLKKSILGISGAALIPGNAKAYDIPSVHYQPSSELPLRTLGRTGIKTPLLSFGTSGALDTGFIRTAYESGIKMFFSATYYGEGNNEIIVGQGLKGLPRDSFIVGTAVPADDIDGRTGKIRDSFNTEAYVKKAEGSLKRFGLDYVDFFLFPYAGKRETVMNDNILKALEQLKKQGKTRFLGIASHSDTEEALKAAIDARIYDIAMISYNYKIKSIDSLNSVIAEAVKSGMGIVAMKSTAGAFREKGGSQPDSNAILKWVLQNENISSIVSGMTSLEQLQKNIAMLKNIRLSEQELRELALASADSETGLYCQQCRNCLPQCPHNLDIPAIMRSYMYAYGYRNIPQAWHTLANTGISEVGCTNCSSCKIKCSSGFDIKKKILDIARLKDVSRDFILS